MTITIWWKRCELWRQRLRKLFSFKIFTPYKNYWIYSYSIFTVLLLLLHMQINIYQCKPWVCCAPCVFWEKNREKVRIELIGGYIVPAERGFLGETVILGTWKPFLQVWFGSVQRSKRSNLQTHRLTNGQSVILFSFSCMQLCKKALWSRLSMILCILVLFEHRSDQNQIWRNGS